MRTQTINQCEVSYPNQIHHNGDNAFVVIKGEGLTAGRLDVTAGERTRTFTATTSTGVIQFDITTFLRSSTADTATFDVHVTRGSVTNESLLTSQLFGGRTLAGRFHASESVVCLPAGFSRADIFLPNIARVNGEQKPAGKVNVELPVTIQMMGGFEYFRGRTWKPIEETTYTITPRVECSGSDRVVLRYTNTDGVKRYAVGKVVSSAMSASAESYSRNTDEVTNRASRVTTGASETIQVAFFDTPVGQYLDDILLADDIVVVTYNVDTPVVITSSTIERKGDVDDYLLTFKFC